MRKQVKASSLTFGILVALSGCGVTDSPGPETIRESEALSVASQFEDGVYVVQNAWTHRYLTEDRAENNGTVSTSARQDGTAQRWAVARAPSGAYTVCSVADGRCLNHSSNANWASVLVHARNPAWASQEWLFEGKADGTLRLQNAWSRDRLNAQAEASGSGVNAGPLDATFQSQRWTFEPVSAPAPVANTLRNANPNVVVGAHFNDRSNTGEFARVEREEFGAGQALWFAGFSTGWPSQGTFNVAPLTAELDRLRSRGMSTHVHMLVGPNFYMPSWLTSRSWSAAELDGLLRKMIDAVLDGGDNKHKVDIWNVANELLGDDGTYRDSVWSALGRENDASGLSGVDKVNATHPLLVRKAFAYVRAKTAAKLEYRDYFIETNHPGVSWNRKHKAAYQLVKHMRNSGIPVDVVGFQGHFKTGQLDWVLQDDQLKKSVEKFRALGVEVQITEMDLGSDGKAWTAAAAEQQRLDYYAFVSQALRGGATRVYTWGVYDGADRSWLTSEHPLLWDEQVRAKPAYEGMRKALADAR